MSSEAGTRSRLYAALTRFPGLYLAALAREARIAEPLARYHMRVLVRLGRATEVVDQGVARYYPVAPSGLGTREVVGRAEKRELAALRRPTSLRIVLELLVSEPEGRTLGQLAEAAEVSPSTVTAHISNLERTGLVRVQRHGRSRLARLRAPNQVADLLARYPPPRDVVSGFIEFWDGLEL